jgi:hypothetical protein
MTVDVLQEVVRFEIQRRSCGLEENEAINKTRLENLGQGSCTSVTLKIEIFVSERPREEMKYWPG